MSRIGVASRGRKAFDTWQIIYIDMLSNMMIFFVILWAVSQREQTKGISDTIGTETARMVNLPGDVLFESGKSSLSEDGRVVFQRLFSDESGTILNFDTGGLTKRLLVIHGHTDSVGIKEENFDLAYQRALAAYHEIQKYGDPLADHAVICTHADNTPVVEVPAFSGALSLVEQNAVRAANKRNRRITIEDKMVSKVLPP